MSPQATTLALPSPTLSLTIDDVVPYLLRRNLLATGAVVDGRVLVEDRSRRNTNFRVEAEPGPSLMVKQAILDEARGTLLTEVRLFEAFERLGEFADCRSFLPRLVHRDAREHVSVVELVEPATTLTKYNENAGALDYPAEGGARAGELLARFHRAGAAAVATGELDFVPANVTGPLKLVEFLPAYRAGDHGPVGETFARTLDAEGRFVLDNARVTSRFASRNDLVHVDARWDNWILTAGDAPDGGLDLRLIDHEFALRGDAMWDVARFVAEYFRSWCFQGVAAMPESLRAFAKVERAGPVSWRASSRAFWRAYVRERGLDAAARRDAYDALAAYLPFAIVHISRELLQRAQKFPTTSHAGIRLASWIAASPEESLRLLYGIRAPEVSA